MTREAIPPALRAALVQARQREAGPDYGVREQPGALVMPNPVQGYRAHLTADGVRIEQPGLADGAVPLTLVSYGCADRQQAVARQRPAVRGGAGQPSRAEYARGGVTEWYENGALGLEQGFTLASPPCAGAGPLRFTVAVSGARDLRQAGEGAAARIEMTAGARRLIYSDLSARDAAGRPLPVRMTLAGERIALAVDARGAAYPLTVDPLVWVQQAKLTAPDAASGDRLGSAVALSGDTAAVRAAGAVYIFVRSGTSWSQQQKLTPPFLSDGGLALSGDTVVIGDRDYNRLTGGAHVFVRAGTSWTWQATLTVTVAADLFAYAAAISGDTVLAGAPYAAHGGLTEPGAAYVYAWSTPLANGTPCGEGIQCTSGYCVDGVCCDSACGGGVATDCQACSVARGAAADGACGTVSDGRVCREAAGACDVAETCTGAGRPDLRALRSRRAAPGL